MSHKLFKRKCHHYNSISMPLSSENKENLLRILLNSLVVPFILSVVVRNGQSFGRRRDEPLDHHGPHCYRPTATNQPATGQDEPPAHDLPSSYDKDKLSLRRLSSFRHLRACRKQCGRRTRYLRARCKPCGRRKTRTWMQPKMP